MSRTSPIPGSANDVLVDVMAAVRVHGTLFCRAVLGAPWGFMVPKRASAAFHYVASGECWLEGMGLLAPAKLETHDLVILPHGDRHTLRDQPGSPARPLEEILSINPIPQDCVLEYGGSGKSTILVCGGFVIENGSANPLVSSLPPVLRLPADRLKPLRWLRNALDWILSEMRDRSPGSEAVTDRLAEILFVEALRAYCAECNSADAGWVLALVDPQVGPTLARIHAAPETAWTVAIMAKEAGISRSSLRLEVRAARWRSAAPVRDPLPPWKGRTPPANIQFEDSGNRSSRRVSIRCCLSQGIQANLQSRPRRIPEDQCAGPADESRVASGRSSRSVT